MAILVECPICRRKQSVTRKRCKCDAALDKAKRSGRVKYWISYRLPGGKQRRELVGTSIDEARDADGKRRGQKREKRIFDILPDSKKTFAQLAEWYLGLDKIIELAWFKAIRRHFDIFNAEYGALQVGDLRLEHLQAFQIKTLKNYSASYTDQVLGTVKAAITLALDNDKIGGDLLKPFRKLRGLLRKGANARTRILTLNEYQALHDHLKPHLKPIVATAWWTGMRQGEILKLRWDKVDLSRRMICLKAEDTKERKPKVVPIAKPLRDILLKLPGRADGGLVFRYGKKTLSDITQGIEAACGASGIAYGRFTEDGFVFHDLRRGFITYARKAGVPKNVVQAITGHRGRADDMNRRYDQVDEGDLLEAVDRIEQLFSASVDQNVDQEAVTI